MSTEKRRNDILLELSEGNAHYSDLMEKFQVSEATIRRDLQWLADNKGVTRTYGGAVVVPSREVPVAERSHEQREEKRQIARAAASLVQEGDYVLLDSGTTAGAVAAELKNTAGITVITNGLNAINELADSDVELIILGGSFRRINQSMVGSITEEHLARFRVDWAFLGADSLDPTEGIGCLSVAQAILKEHMAARSRNLVVVADATKLGRVKGQHRAALRRRYTLITDAAAGQQHVAAFETVADVVQADIDSSIVSSHS